MQHTQVRKRMFFGSNIITANLLKYSGRNLFIGSLFILEQHYLKIGVLKGNISDNYSNPHTSGKILKALVKRVCFNPSIFLH